MDEQLSVFQVDDGEVWFIIAHDATDAAAIYGLQNTEDEFERVEVAEVDDDLEISVEDDDRRRTMPAHEWVEAAGRGLLTVYD